MPCGVGAAAQQAGHPVERMAGRGSGAAVGAAVGGLGAAAHQGLGAEEQYKRAYIKCLEGRGHRVLN